MQFDEIAKLPPLAIIAFGITLAIGLLVVRFGLFQGMKAAPVASAATAQVAAVIVDPSALNRLTGEAAGVSVALEQVVVVGRELVEANRNVARSLNQLTDGISDLRDEVIRSAAKIK